MTVKTILSLKSGDVATIGPTASLETAVRVLAERRIGALVVMDCAPRCRHRVRARHRACARRAGRRRTG